MKRPPIWANSYITTYRGTSKGLGLRVRFRNKDPSHDVHVEAAKPFPKSASVRQKLLGI